jgi:hypothetical protein
MLRNFFGHICGLKSRPNKATPLSDESTFIKTQEIILLMTAIIPLEFEL